MAAGQVPAAHYLATPPPVLPAYRPSAVYPPYEYSEPPEVQRRKEIIRTETGVLLLVVGILASWIPFVGAVGLAITFVGALLVIFGRRAFGPIHRRNLTISILLFVLATAVVFIAGAVIVLAALGSIPSGSDQAHIAAVFETAITNLLIVSAVGATVTSLSNVLFTYALQNRVGRLLLWAALGASLGLQAAIVVLALPLLPGISEDIARQIVTSGRVDTAAMSSAISGQASGLGLVGVIPAAMYALADYLAFARIHRGEIPLAELDLVPAAVAPPARPPAPPIPPQ